MTKTNRDRVEDILTRHPEVTFTRRSTVEEVTRKKELANGTVEDEQVEWFKQAELLPNQLTAYHLATMQQPSFVRMLTVAQVGAGKTLIIIRILNELFDDPRPKIVVFPTESVKTNFYTEISQYPSKWRDYLVRHFRNNEAKMRRGTPHIKPDGTRNPAITKSDSELLQVSVGEIERVLAQKKELLKLNNPQYWKSKANTFRKYFDIGLPGISVHEVAVAMQMTADDFKLVLAGQRGASQKQFDVLRRLINEALRQSGKRIKELERLESTEDMPASGLRAFTYRTCGGNSVITGVNSPLWKDGYFWDDRKGVWVHNHTKSGTLHGKVILMDEVHNLITLDEDEEAQPLSVQNGCGTDQQCLKEFERRLYEAQESMVIGFTATPNKTSPMDAKRLLQYINGKDNEKAMRRAVVSYFMSRPSTMFAQIVNPDPEDQVSYLEFVQPAEDGAFKLTTYVKNYIEKRYGKKVNEVTWSKRVLSQFDDDHADDEDDMFDDDDEDDEDTKKWKDEMWRQFGDLPIDYRGDENPHIKTLRGHITKLNDSKLQNALDNLARDSKPRDYLEYPEYTSSYLGSQSPETYNSATQAWYAALANGPKVEGLKKKGSKMRSLVLGSVEEDAGAENRALKLDWIAEEVENPVDDAYSKFLEKRNQLKSGAIPQQKTLVLIDEKHGLYTLVFLLRLRFDGYDLKVGANVMCIPFGGLDDETLAFLKRTYRGLSENDFQLCRIKQAYEAKILKSDGNVYTVQYVCRELKDHVEENVPRHLMYLTNTKVTYLTNSPAEIKRFRMRDGSTEKEAKQTLTNSNEQKREEFNHKTNKHGDKKKVMVIDRKKFNEGVSFFDVRTLVFASVPESYAAYQQGLGRPLRAFGHRNLDESERTLWVRMFVMENPVHHDNPKHYTLDQKRFAALKQDKEVMETAMCELAIESDDRQALNKRGNAKDNCDCPSGCVEKSFDACKKVMDEYDEEKQKKREEAQRRNLQRQQEEKKKRDAALATSDAEIKKRIIRSFLESVHKLVKKKFATAEKDDMVAAIQVLRQAKDQIILADETLVQLSAPGPQKKVNLGYTVKEGKPIQLQKLTAEGKDHSLISEIQTITDAQAMQKIEERYSQFKRLLGLREEMKKELRLVRGMQESSDLRVFRRLENTLKLMKNVKNYANEAETDVPSEFAELAQAVGIAQTRLRELQQKKTSEDEVKAKRQEEKLKKKQALKLAQAKDAKRSVQSFGLNFQGPTVEDAKRRGIQLNVAREKKAKEFGSRLVTPS
jgi:superfamily II DNA or RNA helicase